MISNNLAIIPPLTQDSIQVYEKLLCVFDSLRFILGSSQMDIEIKSLNS